MKVRGQNDKAWVARWQQGTCPVHGRGLASDEALGDEAAVADPPSAGVAVHCSHEECELAARQWPGKDRWHSLFGWSSGPDDVKAALLQMRLIDEDSEQPGKHARNVRTSWPLGEDED